MSADSVVAVDVGNSAVSLGIEKDGQFVPHFVSLRQVDWTLRCIQWVREQLGEGRKQWLIASVRSSAAIQLVQYLASESMDEAYHVTRFDIPIELAVDSPERVGIDRLLAAHGAARFLPFPFVVVDAGSAITVDWVDGQGRFAGGAILPGLSLQAEALHRWTEALPDLSGELSGPIRLPGTNTSDAIRGGIVAGSAGAIDALIDSYVQSAGQPLIDSIALTGGHAPLIAPHLKQKFQLLPNLVCRGLLELPRSKQEARLPS